jgi:hypothetical protein
MSRRLVMGLFGVLVLLGLVAMRVLMNHQHTVAAQALQAYQRSVNGMRDTMSGIEQMLSADRTARAELLEGCKDVLRQAGVQLGQSMERLLLQQEMRLMRNWEMHGAARAHGARGQQALQPGAHQTIVPERPATPRR